MKIMLRNDKQCSCANCADSCDIMMWSNFRLSNLKTFVKNFQISKPDSAMKYNGSSLLRKPPCIPPSMRPLIRYMRAERKVTE